MNDLKTLTAIIGAFIGLVGFLYAVFKDRQVREIEKRSKAPHFIPEFLKIEATAKFTPQNARPYYTYSQQPSALDSTLFEMDPWEKAVPDDYPSQKVVALVVRNDGSKLRFYRIKSKEDVLMNAYRDRDDHYELRYALDRHAIGDVLKFELLFETEAGIQGSQVWALEKGSLMLTRLKPRAV